METNLKIKQKDIDEFGEDFKKIKHRYVDYLQLGGNEYPWGLEAKDLQDEFISGK